MFLFDCVKYYLFGGARFIFVCFVFQDGNMSHAENQILPDRYHPINDGYSYCEVNLKCIKLYSAMLHLYII